MCSLGRSPPLGDKCPPPLLLQALLGPGYTLSSLVAWGTMAWEDGRVL